MGPNTSGKTSLLEAAATSLILNYTDIKFTNYYLAVMHAARGSEKHSMALLVPSGDVSARTCILLGGEKACTEITKESRQESRGP